MKRLLLAAALFTATSCHQPSREEARLLVEHYNQVVCEAYRRSDAKLIAPDVGPTEGKKLAGLIGVRLDFGLTLDAKLLSLEVRDVTRENAELHVSTRESWSYRDLKIGTGAQVGESSRDSYEMLYIFKRINRMWKVDEIRFNAPPQIGRTNPIWGGKSRSPQSSHEGKSP